MQQMQRLLDIMTRLRDPHKGCPWDVEQNFATIAPYTIEEAYEVSEAISQNDMQGLREELGDLLLQVVFHSQMAREEGLFDFEDVAESISDKMVRRHPHVFGAADIKTADDQLQNWERIKQEERKAKGKDDEPVSLLDDVPPAMPALIRAEKLQKRAASVGFDWPSIGEVFDKLQEEIGELQQEVDRSSASEVLLDEIGDILFVVANIARHCKVDPEEALRHANRKFTRRFQYIEKALRSVAKTLQESNLEEMDALWNEAKMRERQGGKRYTG